jgi:two-component sensor histidine kinase
MGLLTIQANRTKSLECIDRISAVRRQISVIEILSRSNNLVFLDGDVDLSRFLAELAQDLREQFCSWDVQFNFEGLELLKVPNERAIPIAIAVGELLANALRHGRPRSGDHMISLQTSKIEDMLWIEVKDNGKGLPPGFDFENDTNSGLDIAKGLAEQAGGSLDFAPFGSGAHFRLMTPAAVRRV